MNTTAQIAEAIRLGVALTALWILFFWLIRDYRVDAFRQRLFNVRDQLFDDAAAGIIPFDHPAYGMLRKTLNGFIRFGHRITVTRVILAMIAYGVFPKLRKSPLPSFSAELQEASSSLPTQEAKNKIDQAHRRMQVVVGEYIITGAPILFLPILLVVIFLAACWLFRHGRDGRRKVLTTRVDLSPRVREKLREKLATNVPGMELIEFEAQAIGGSQAYAAA